MLSWMPTTSFFSRESRRNLRGSLPVRIRTGWVKSLPISRSTKMKDEEKTKDELINELVELRQIFD